MCYQIGVMWKRSTSSYGGGWELEMRYENCWKEEEEKKGGIKFGELGEHKNQHFSNKYVFTTTAMDDAEFGRLLDFFPIVRSRDYRAESEQCRESTSKSAQHEEYAHIHTQDVDVFECSQQHKEWQDAWDEGDKIEVEKQGLDEHGEFWEKLKLVAERKVGAAEAERFCKAFQRIHKKLDG
ncbi:hypothetical protein DVH24_005566 [Malus domestica]|uniref:Uncharacterized protein n=1 Tax=Malus domestica TaxID=3750 RepID=A0A498IQ03_MALDO|nr:hypothetical protein DVH24_005566 [Malus domestica]